MGHSYISHDFPTSLYYHHDDNVLRDLHLLHSVIPQELLGFVIKFVFIMQKKLQNLLAVSLLLNVPEYKSLHDGAVITTFTHNNPRPVSFRLWCFEESSDCLQFTGMIEIIIYLYMTKA